MLFYVTTILIFIMESPQNKWSLNHSYDFIEAFLFRFYSKVMQRFKMFSIHCSLVNFVVQEFGSIKSLTGNLYLFNLWTSMFTKFTEMSLGIPWVSQVIGLNPWSSLDRVPHKIGLKIGSHLGTFLFMETLVSDTSFFQRC